jgi:hypothetical protein
MGNQANYCGSPNFSDPVSGQAHSIAEGAVGHGSRARNVYWNTLHGSDEKTNKIKTVIEMRNW